jgi:hypothetical protein
MVVALVGLAPAPAFAAAGDAKEACANAAEAGMALLDEGALLAARDTLRRCATPKCPSVIARDCTAALDDVDKRLPTIVPRVVDGSGRDLEGASLKVDGKEIALDGRAVPLDPGERTFVAKVPGRPAITRKVVVREGEKGRAISIEADPGAPRIDEPEAPQPAKRAPIPERPETRRDDDASSALPWITGGAAVALLAVGTGLWVSAGADERGLLGSCAPRCDPRDVDAIERKQGIAIGFWAGAAIATGVTIAIAWPRGTDSSVRATIGPQGIALAGRF